MTATLKKLTPNLMVEDVNRTVAFYQEVLGFELLTSVPEEGQLDLCGVRSWMKQ
jgi:catechol 2,3-dioxygenase-like lactoylglutathione lyase family enzyme